MNAMVFRHPGTLLQHEELPVPEPAPGQVLIRVRACAVCRTDLHLVDGDLPFPKQPVIPGHEIIGRVEKLGPGVRSWRVGDRVGVTWLGWACGVCRFCLTGREHLCDAAKFTGYTLDGGFADYTVADERFCIPVPFEFVDDEAAPLLCAGLIGYRALRKAGPFSRLGIYGFGAAGHIAIQIARAEGAAVYIFTRPADRTAQDFARNLGAFWVGDSGESAPHLLDAALIFAPVGALIPAALKQVEKGGVIVCGGIHMSDIPAFPYALLWGERTVCSVANVNRRDGAEFFEAAQIAGVKTCIERFPLSKANAALDYLRTGKLCGAAVLINGFD